LWQAALAVLLDSLPDAALLMTKRGHVELANSVALRMLEDPRSKSALLALRAAVVSGKNSDSFVVTDLNSRGCPGFVLAVSAQNGSRIDAAVARAEASWKVRGRRALVLERLARGESNKQIANALGCAEVTVERHVSELFRRSGTRSRTELLRALFDS
jgi:DNA-binding NarL/FixJ family response regulator